MKPKPSNDSHAAEECHGVDTLIPRVYKELRRLASAKCRGERSEHTLQPTAVVHEAYLRLKGTNKRWESETEFRRYAAPVIRHVLVDYARQGPPSRTIMVTPCWEGMDAEDTQNPSEDVLAIHVVLDRLGKCDPGLAQMVELRYFGGLTEKETAEAMSIPLGTLKNRLTFARTWLRRELTKSSKLSSV